LVNYKNFLEYTKENGLSLGLKIIAKELHSLIMTPSGQGFSTYKELIQKWFIIIDHEKTGKFNLTELTSFLDQYKLTTNPEIAKALFLSMISEPASAGPYSGSDLGVFLSDFVQWVKNVPDLLKGDVTGYSNLPLVEIQRKGYVYMVAVASGSASTG
jgi:hypothetical protein